MLSSLKQWHQVISTLLWKNKYFIIYCITYEEFLWYWMWILFFKSCSHCFPVNPLQPNISMHILHTVLFTSPKVLTRRICLRIKSFFFGDHSLYSHNLNVWFRGDFNLIIRFDSLTVITSLFCFRTQQGRNASEHWLPATTGEHKELF